MSHIKFSNQLKSTTDIRLMMKSIKAVSNMFLQKNKENRNSRSEFGIDIFLHVRHVIYLT